jgi:hypothetical protein
MRMQLTRIATCALALAATTQARADDPPLHPPSEFTPEELRDVLDDQAPLPPPDPDSATGTVRGGVYADSDQTVVLRTFGVIAKTWDHWLANGTIGVDSVTSASVDVRSSPGLSRVDTMTSASGRSSTSGGEMQDTRVQLTSGGGWSDGARTVAGTAAVAAERDYTSVSGGINGSYDVRDRTVTLLGGVTATDNWVSSVLDPSLHRKMFSTGWSAGAAYVVTRLDAIRLRYDGKLADGYQASPYRNVRFGDWVADLGSEQITFMNTIGSADGLPEQLPQIRTSHAVTLEWVHSLADGVGMHPELRVAHDSWGIDSVSAAADVRIARPTWRLSLGYRFYAQTRAEFFEGKYDQAPNTYAYYTSDKELGDERGHQVRFDVSYVLMPADQIGDRKLVFNFQVDATRYRYPGFLLLSSRDSVYASLGLTWEH